MNTQITKRWECLRPIIIFRDHNLGQIQFPVFDRWQKFVKLMEWDVEIYVARGKHFPLLPQTILGKDREEVPLQRNVSRHPSQDHCPHRNSWNYQDSGKRWVKLRERGGLAQSEFSPHAFLCHSSLTSGPSWEGEWRQSQQPNACRGMTRK